MGAAGKTGKRGSHTEISPGPQGRKGDREQGDTRPGALLHLGDWPGTRRSGTQKESVGVRSQAGLAPDLASPARLVLPTNWDSHDSAVLEGFLLAFRIRRAG